MSVHGVMNVNTCSFYLLADIFRKALKHHGVGMVDHIANLFAG